MSQLAILQHNPAEPLHEHVLAAWQGFAWDKRRVQFSDFFWPNELQRIPCDPDVPFVGTIKATLELFQHWGIEPPKPLNVPEQLLGWAGRRIQRMTIDSFDPDNLLSRPAFIKPADDVKLWTGDVVTKAHQLPILFGDAPGSTPILVSPVVKILSEHRVFVDRDRKIVAMRHYAGDPFIVPMRLSVEQMIRDYTDAPRCYALDVGMRPTQSVNARDPEDSGPPTPFVVECNDFWALGSYGMDPITYSRMLAQRWHQLITNGTNHS